MDSKYIHEVEGFDWDPANIAHIHRHEVEPWECESMMVDDPMRQDRVQSRGPEPRILSRGITRQGRPLLVVWTVRRNRLRVVTARQMTDAEYAQYRGW